MDPISPPSVTTAQATQQVARPVDKYCHPVQPAPLDVPLPLTPSAVTIHFLSLICPILSFPRFQRTTTACFIEKDVLFCGVVRAIS